MQWLTLKLASESAHLDFACMPKCLQQNILTVFYEIWNEGESTLDEFGTTTV